MEVMPARVAPHELDSATDATLLKSVWASCFWYARGAWVSTTVRVTVFVDLLSTLPWPKISAQSLATNTTVLVLTAWTSTVMPAPLPTAAAAAPFTE